MSCSKLFSMLNYTILSCLIWIYVESLSVVPERANMTYYNKKYVVEAFVNVRRYSRKSPYYFNVWGETMITLGNNITIDIVFKELLHNEYRRSFIEFHYKLCDLINNEPYIGTLVKEKGITCPIPAGKIAVMNITNMGNNFPNVFPFKKGRIDFTLNLTPTKELIAQFYVVCMFS